MGTQAAASGRQQTRMGQLKKKAKEPPEAPYTHTHAAFYTVVVASVACLFTDSTKGILDKYHLTRYLWFLYGALFFSAYVYVRPFIRHNIGSAQNGTINFYSIYLGWLLSAWVYHLPGFGALGIDIKADVSLMLLIFFVSAVALGTMHGLYTLAAECKVINHRLFSKSARTRDRVNLVLVNSSSFALACSTYYSFCGNTGVEGGGSNLQDICSSLQPMNSTDYPAFANWVLYEEQSQANLSAAAFTVALEDVSFPMEASTYAISPVLTLWLTLTALFVVNCLADHWASFEIFSQGMVAKAGQRGLQTPRKSLDEGQLHRTTSLQHPAMGDDRAHSIRRSHESVLRSKMSRSNSVSLPDLDIGGWCTAAGSHLMNILSQQNYAQPQTSGSDASVDSTSKPEFLPMVAWFSGTSADLLKTVFDLAISLKIFLGRFDMREMQAATSAAEIHRPLPNGCDGDGFTYEHYADQDELWVDFCADTGDGGDSTYTVARALASPELRVRPAEGTDLQYVDQSSVPRCSDGSFTLPRGNLMVIGGDLAYPNPSDYTYEKRLFRPFEDALPPPRHYHPGRVVLQKPDLPPDHPAMGMCDCDSISESTVKQPEARGREERGYAASWVCRALRRYEGPQCFAIPGNHDWIDGLETFMRHFGCKGWLGGWMLPQEKSYFALHLPQGWWLFGLDLGLVNDIDIFQYRYFAHIAETRLAAGDNVVLVTHQPIWLLDWYHQKREGQNLNQLVQGHLRGRVPVHLAGDLHFYMRHSLQKPDMQPAGSEEMAGAANDDSEASAESPLSGWGPQPAGISPVQSFCGTFPGLSGTEVPTDGHPDHLIVNGAGGAFLHPTHIFAEASWYAKNDSATESIASMHKCKGCGVWSRGTSNGSSPRGYSLSVPPGWEGLFPMLPGRAKHQPALMAAPVSDTPLPKYTCASSYPAPQLSKQLAKGNMMFRHANMKFDVIGGLWYFLLVVGAAPGCSSVGAILDATSFSEGLYSFAAAAVSALEKIVLESHVSLAALVGIFLALLGFAKAGGYGIVSQDQELAFEGGNAAECSGSGTGAQPASPKYTETYRMRSGGIVTQVVVAVVHTAVHLSMAISLMLMLDLAIETCVRYQHLGSEGYHSLYSWYREFEEQHFPDPNHLRQTMESYTLHAYPVCIKWLMTLFDLPEAVALGRGAACAEGWASLTRLEFLGYYAGMLAYYWVLATPAIAAIFGCYLYISVCIFHVHHDEGFSSMRLPHYKGFLRIHIAKSGDLNIWSLGMDKTADRWQEDPRWRGFLGGGDKRIPSYKAKYPSRWLPVTGEKQTEGSPLNPSSPEIRVVDHLVVKKKPGLCHMHP